MLNCHQSVKLSFWRGPAKPKKEEESPLSAMPTPCMGGFFSRRMGGWCARPWGLLRGQRAIIQTPFSFDVRVDCQQPPNALYRVIHALLLVTQKAYFKNWLCRP